MILFWSTKIIPRFPGLPEQHPAKIIIGEPVATNRKAVSLKVVASCHPDYLVGMKVSICHKRLRRALEIGENQFVDWEDNGLDITPRPVSEEDQKKSL